MAVIAVAWIFWFLLLLEKSLRSYSSTTYNAYSTSAATNANESIEAVLIIATAPYSANHVMALWTQLECLTSGIDRVLISAPDTEWSRDIIAQVIYRFTQLSNTTTFALEAVFNPNNRYDVGLWCDGLDHIDAHNTSTGGPRAVFLINDSAAALSRYDALTNRIVNATRIEDSNTTKNKGGTTKLISLNGEIHGPGVNKTTWIESVYQGLTPDGASTFYKHSCSDEVRWACAGKGKKAAKQCVIDLFEKALASFYAKSELGVMYPSYLLPEWNVSRWEAMHGIIEPDDHWLFGRRYFWYLYEVHDFPIRKLKWPTSRGLPPDSMCLRLLDDNLTFEDLPYPSLDTLNVNQAGMSKLESSL